MTPAQRWLPTLRTLRIGLIFILTLVGLFTTTVFIHQLILPALAVYVPQLKPTFYDLAVYGTAPTRKYISSGSQPPELSVLQWHERCDDEGLIFIAPYGDMVETPGPTILDARGNLVWATQEYQTATNFRMQEFNGEQFLTFWAGHKEGAKGKGAMYMLNSKYEIAHKLQAVGEGLFSDLHEFQLTNDGTALLTVYNDTTVDMRDFGLFRGEHGWVTDCIFQEIDVETNELLFQWVASENVRPADTHYIQPTAGFSESVPFDYFHMNSIEKDSKGNYLISSRHFHTITYIEGRTGKTLWTVGADSADFRDISAREGAATDFCWSHHARWLSEEEGLISLFDNGNAGPLHLDRSYSKGMLIQVDTTKGTVRHIQDYKPMQNIRAHSQGNMQYLSNKDEIFIGWGGSAMWSQFELDGTLLCEVHYGASLMYFFEKVKSYRIFKSWGWKGEPQWPPSAAIHEGKIYASWNGATEVRSWRVEGREDDDKDVGNFKEIQTVAKEGFETAIELPLEGYARFRVVALDANNEDMQHSDPVEPEEPESMVPVVMGSCASVLFIAGLVALLRYFLVKRELFGLDLPWRRRVQWQEYEYSKL